MKGDPANASAPFNLGDMLRAAARTVEAEAALRAATRANPAFGEAWYNLADLLDDQGRSAAAVECLRKALLVAPDCIDATFNLALLLQRKGDSLSQARFGGIDFAGCSQDSRLLGSGLLQARLLLCPGHPDHFLYDLAVLDPERGRSSEMHFSPRVHRKESDEEIEKRPSSVGANAFQPGRDVLAVHYEIGRAAKFEALEYFADAEQEVLCRTPTATRRLQ
jgi:tetratricopeptide (TPR) repeat protein